MNTLKKFTLTRYRGRFDWWAHISKMLTQHKGLSRLFLLLNTFPLFLPLCLLKSGRVFSPKQTLPLGKWAEQCLYWGIPLQKPKYSADIQTIPGAKLLLHRNLTLRAPEKALFNDTEDINIHSLNSCWVLVWLVTCPRHFSFKTTKTKQNSASLSRRSGKS